MSTMLPARAVKRAQEIIGAVRERNPETVARLTACRCCCDCGCKALTETIVTLAAMVPDDKSPADLLAWNDSVAAVPLSRSQPRALAPHGTHAAFNRHRKNGTDPCDTCVVGERQYQRTRPRRLRVVDDEEASA